MIVCVVVVVVVVAGSLVASASCARVAALFASNDGWFVTKLSADATSSASVAMAPTIASAATSRRERLLNGNELSTRRHLHGNPALMDLL